MAFGKARYFCKVPTEGMDDSETEEMSVPWIRWFKGRLGRRCKSYLKKKNGCFGSTLRNFGSTCVSKKFSDIWW